MKLTRLAQHRRAAEEQGATASDDPELQDFSTPVASRGNVQGAAADLDGDEMEKHQRALQTALEEEERVADMIRSTSQTTLAHFRSRQKLDDLAGADSEWSAMDDDHLGVGRWGSFFNTCSIASTLDSPPSHAGRHCHRARALYRTRGSAR